MKISQLRIENNLTREELANLADISAKFLYEIEYGKKGFSAFTLYKIVQAFNVSFDIIIDFDRDDEKT